MFRGDSTPAVVQNYSGWNYVGCFADTLARVYPNLLYPPLKTIESCLDTALTAGYTAAGIEYGGECDVFGMLDESIDVDEHER